MLFNSCKAVCLVSAQQIPSESFPTAPPQQRASFRKKIITAVCLSMNLAEHTAANLALFESGALYLITFSRHIVRLAENLKNDTVILFPRCSQNSGGFRQFSMTVTPTY